MSELLAESVESWSGKDRGDENFPVGVLVSPRLRPHVHAFYAFARNADDIADAARFSAAEKLARLDAMQAVLDGRGDGSDAGRSPTAARLRESLAATGVSAQHAHDLLDAFRQDATKRRYADWAELMQYCRLSAMPVGRHVLDLHGEAASTTAPSDALCAVLQVLNHMQDAGQDLATLDRCYVPQDMLHDAGATMADLQAPAMSPALRTVFDRMLAQCAPLQEQAERLPLLVRDRRLRLETAVIVGLARRLARRLRGGDVLATRVRLTKLDAAASAVAALRRW